MAKGKISIIFFVSVFLLFGCQQADTQSQPTQSKPKKAQEIHHQFYYFTSEEINSNGGNIGKLAYKTPDNDSLETITKKAKEYYVKYENDEDTTFYLDENNSLYKYDSESDSTKLATDVHSYDSSLYSNGIVFYSNDDNDLYMIRDDEDSVKIARNVIDYFLVDEELYYVNDAGNFKLYHIANRTETDLATDVYNFLVLDVNGELVYTNKDNFLYYVSKKGEESVRISSDSIHSLRNVEKIGDTLLYGAYDSEIYNLYQTDLKDNFATEKIVSDLDIFAYDEKTQILYYINSDYDLMQKKLDDESAIKIASDVDDFSLAVDGYFYQDEKHNVYYVDSQDEETLLGQDNIIYHTLADSGELIYVTEDDELFVNDQKLTSELNHFSYQYNNLIYSTDDRKLFMMENMDDPIEIDDDLSNYYSVFYHDELVFENQLSLKDIAGVWSSADSFFEIKSNGTIIELLFDEEYKFEIGYATPDTITLLDESEKAMTITRQNKDEITLEFTDSEFTLYKSTKGEVEEYKAEIEQTVHREEMEDLIGSYLFGFVKAIDYSDGSYIADLIDPASKFYTTQISYVEGLVGRGIYEELIDYDIQGTEKLSDGIYKVTVNEQFIIYNINEGSEKNVNFKNVYTVKLVDGKFLITDLELL